VEAIRKAIEATFAKTGKEHIKFSTEATPTTTGWLEVNVDGVLVHSKKNGNGYVNTQDKMNAILNRVRTSLTGQAAPAGAKA